MIASPRRVAMAEPRAARFAAFNHPESKTPRRCWESTAPSFGTKADARGSHARLGPCASELGRPIARNPGIHGRGRDFIKGARSKCRTKARSLCRVVIGGQTGARPG